MQESLATEHSSELFRDTFEQLLNSCAVTYNTSQQVSYSFWPFYYVPINVADILRPRGGISQTAVFTLFGIHSTKYDEFLFWTFNICSSTSFIDMRPRKMVATVKYRPWRGSHAAIMFLASNICWVSSGTVSARYCCDPRDVNGAKPGMKKWRRGNGTMFTANLRRSAFNWPIRKRAMNRNLYCKQRLLYYLESEDRLWHLTWSLTPSDWDHHMLVWWVLVFGNKYRIRLHCQCNRFHRCFRRVDEQIELHCMVQQQCPIPWVMEQHWMSSWYL